jgi:hypothetical protein
MCVEIDRKKLFFFFLIIFFARFVCAETRSFVLCYLKEEEESHLFGNTSQFTGFDLVD